jgi:hypothetical protein
MVAAASDKIANPTLASILPSALVSGVGDGFGVGAGMGCIQVDNLAQRDLAAVEFLPPHDKGLEGKRVVAAPPRSWLSGRPQTLGESDFALVGEQFHRAHSAEVQAHRVVGSLGRATAAWRILPWPVECNKMRALTPAA